MPRLLSLLFTTVLFNYILQCKTESNITLKTSLLYFGNANLKCENKIVIQKCCPPNQYVTNARRKSCGPHTTALDFSDAFLFDGRFNLIEKNVKEHFCLAPGIFETNETAKEMYHSLPSVFHYLMVEDGELVVEHPNAYTRYYHVNSSMFCVDYLLRTKKVPHPQVRYWALITPPEAYLGREEETTYLTVAFVVSSFFLLLTLLVYGILPQLRNLPGLILMSCAASLLGAFLLLAIIRSTQYLPMICIGLTSAIYFFLLSSFCWLNVMSFDIWWTFRGYAKARPIHRRGETVKYLTYCLYAWGIPLFMAIAMPLIDSMDLRDHPSFIKPNLVSMGCFLEGGEKFVYLYIPMLILIMANWVLFLLTAYNVWRLGRGSAVLNAAAGSPAAHRMHRRRFLVYLKLSVVMGINWLLEVVSTQAPDYGIWYITDLYNVLIGLAIFLIFVCKKKVLVMLKKKLRGIRKSRLSQTKSYSSSTTDSGISQDTPLQVCTVPRGVF